MDRTDELKRQEEIWEKRRQISGHGALDGAGKPKDEPLIVMVAGPIGWWWDDNWMTPEHIHYDKWRTAVVEALVANGFLAYLPFNAFKGTWTNRAQVVNNAIVLACDVILDLTPYGVRSEGTEAELELAVQYRKHIVNCPPTYLGDPFEAKIEALIRVLKDIELDKAAQV